MTMITSGNKRIFKHGLNVWSCLRPVVMASMVTLAAMLLVPNDGWGCNAFTFTMGTPLNPMQGSVQRIVGMSVKGKTGLQIVVAESIDIDGHLVNYTKGKSDLLVLTGEEPKGFSEKVAALPGKRIEGKRSGVTFVIHPDTLKLFPKFADLFAGLAETLDEAGREGIRAVTDDDDAKRLLGKGK